MNEELPRVRAVVVVALLGVVVFGFLALALFAVLALVSDVFPWNREAVRLIVLPFVVLGIYGFRAVPRELAWRARSQGRSGDAESIERATRIVYPAFGVLVGVGAVYALLQTFPAREVLKILLLPPLLVGGIFVAWMYADMGDPGVKGWTLALFVVVVTGGLSWFIVQL